MWNSKTRLRTIEQLFHGAPVAYALDFLAIPLADVASIAERRTDRMLDVSRSHGLPPFLADDPGVDSGHMIAQYTQAAIVSELKRLAVPASVDSIPSSAMQEDHVSMGWAAARKLRRAIDGLGRVLAIEILTAARANGLKFGVSVHASHAWSWYETSQGTDKKGDKAGLPYDGKLTKADGKGQWWEGLDPQDLYAELVAHAF